MAEKVWRGIPSQSAQVPYSVVSLISVELDVLLVLGKGRRERALPFGRKAGEAFDRYLCARARHKGAALPWLWLVKKDRLTELGWR